ncbi:MAG TPA: metalloregulator ArsR/SmtB family transcription factor [Spirochaetota bacterium]|jgi:ArsR family transcriptional regulator|nr:MAG: HTH-type transcriptional repressor CzrA [Spirochaetes bacterium ADurb.Bin133]HNZ26832.1 metalloregulator ArsR/SmtB family transcription factor [Spirochaetota bacterium]HOF01878.1 metalloregulator ArsR/SmtB family transcription factor [Spirochaetota bacterium]HOS33628.1 metalloregulator ArsR/SmtB family transcription factor [Spirochaetota bacterium]HOS56734.1 metalloregulator ArsR/SmtB family transcription factor [Spirochaetota bacterium]
MTEDELVNYAEIFKALGHPTRLEIVKELVEKGETDVSKMIDRFNISQSNLSQHLAILRRTRLVKSAKKGQRVCYKVEDDKIRKIINAIS